MAGVGRTRRHTGSIAGIGIFLLLVSFGALSVAPRFERARGGTPSPAAVAFNALSTPTLAPSPFAPPTAVPTSAPTATVFAGTPVPVVLVNAALRANVAFPTASPTPTVAASATSAASPAAPATEMPVMDAGDGPLKKGRLVTWYGQPDSPALGILGEFSDQREMIRRLKLQAAAYTAADPAHPAIPTIELIASVASDTPGKDGLYLNPTRPELIEEYVRIAKDNNCLILLDIQLGYDSVAHEVQRLLPYLAQSHVHLAIDPEFHVKRGEVPGETFGSVTAAEVNDAAKMLAQVATEKGIGDKLLLVHQFRYDMLPDKKNIHPTPHVEFVINMDGFGGPGAKTDNYGVFVRDEPIQYGGIKLFYKQDKPLMTPEQVVALTPTPLVVIYQ